MAKMEYNKFADKLKECATKLAESKGFTKIEVTKSGHGLWVGFDKFYAEELGNPCTDNIKFHSEDSKFYIEFRYRFSNPCISIHNVVGKREDSSFAGVEFTQHYYDYEPESDSTKEYKHLHIEGGECRVHEVHAWGEDGLVYLSEILKFTKEFLGDSFTFMNNPKD